MPCPSAWKRPEPQAQSGLAAPGSDRWALILPRRRTPSLGLWMDQALRDSASLWLSWMPPALIPVLTFRPPSASLWLSWMPPALIPVLTFRPPSASLWLSWTPPALIPVLTFRPPCASLWLSEMPPALIPVLTFIRHLHPIGSRPSPFASGRRSSRRRA